MSMKTYELFEAWLPPILKVIIAAEVWFVFRGGLI